MSTQPDPRIAELLQNIFSTSWTAMTALGLGKAATQGEISERFVDLSEVTELSIHVGYDAVSNACNDADELSKLLGVEIKSPIALELKPVFAKGQEEEEAQS